MHYTQQQILNIINTQLPLWIKKDEKVKDALFYVINLKYQTKKDSDDKFVIMLKELAEERVRQDKKWEEWIIEDNKKWDDQNKKWDEQNKKWDDQNKKWDDQNKKWDEQNKKWEENTKRIDGILEEIKLGNRRHDQSMGAIGTRWGLHSEASFRNALKGILKDLNSEYEVTHYHEFDDEGIVFDQPDQVELDVIVKNGITYLAELKSSVGKADVFIFLRKIKFYEKRHKQQVSQGIIISPMIDEKAKNLIDISGLKLYSYAEDVDV